MPGTQTAVCGTGVFRGAHPCLCIPIRVPRVPKVLWADRAGTYYGRSTRPTGRHPASRQRTWTGDLSAADSAPISTSKSPSTFPRCRKNILQDTQAQWQRRHTRLLPIRDDDYLGSSRALPLHTHSGSPSPVTSTPQPCRCPTSSILSLYATPLPPFPPLPFQSLVAQRGSQITNRRVESNMLSTRSFRARAAWASLLSPPSSPSPSR